MPSDLETLRSKGIRIELSGNDYVVKANRDRVVIEGCDCANVLTDAEVQHVYDLLGTYLRHARNRKG